MQRVSGILLSISVQFLCSVKAKMAVGVVSSACLCVMACSDAHRPIPVSNPKADIQQVETNADEKYQNAGASKKNFCKSPDSFRMPEINRRYAADAVYDEEADPGRVWEPSSNDLEIVNKSIPECLINSYCMYEDEIYAQMFEDKISRANDVIERLSEYWLFYSGVYFGDDKVVLYSFFVPNLYEVEERGGVEAIWDENNAFRVGGGSRFWRIEYNMRTGKCAASINSRR